MKLVLFNGDNDLGIVLLIDLDFIEKTDFSSDF